MIVPMKKVAVLVQFKNADSAVKKLGALGVMHVEHQRLPKGDDVDSVLNEIELIEKALSILRKTTIRGKEPLKEKKISTRWKRIAGHVIDLNDRLSRLEEYARIARNTLKEWDAWGEFNPDIIRGLEEKGVSLRLYKIPVKKIKDFPGSVIVKTLFREKGAAGCAVISRGKTKIPFRELTLPKMAIEKIKKRLSDDERVIEKIKGQMRRYLPYESGLEEIKRLIEKELEFQKVLSGMGRSGEIMYLTGYTPYDAENLILKTAKNEHWGVRVEDPSSEDRVPTLIRNPRWVSIIEPVFKIIEIVPGYHEFDISLWFLVFLSIFFGMLIGDAGYGIIFFGLTFLAQRKWARKVKSNAAFILFYLFSSCAILWGVLSGTFFGQEWLPGWVKPLLPALRNDKNIQALCFFLGALHLSIAHVWRAIVKLPSPRALADIGWTSVLWGAFFLAKTLILGDSFPAFGKWFFITGPILVVLFTNPSKNILKGLSSGIGNLLLNFVNNFTDVVSYIRLFAVGLASVAIADAFNKMAMGLGYNSFITGLGAALILFIGHGLNILLGPLAVLVHGVRLNVLEFCNHMDIKWSGFSYKPLKEGD